MEGILIFFVAAALVALGYLARMFAEDINEATGQLKKKPEQRGINQPTIRKEETHREKNIKSINK